MMNPELNNPLLRRYWFKIRGQLGIGVTAYSLNDAMIMLDKASRILSWELEILEIVEDIDIRDLDQNHVVPNIGPPNFRGVWFPNLTL